MAPHGRRKDPAGEGETRAHLGTTLLRLTPVLMVVVGLAGSTLLLWSLRSAERAAVGEAFNLEAGQVAADVSREFQVAVEQVNSVADFYAASEHVERHEFHDFTVRSLERIPALRLLGWVETISGPRISLGYGEGPAAAVALAADLGAEPVLRAALERGRTLEGPQLTAAFPALAGQGGSWVAVVRRARTSSEEDAGLLLACIEPERLLASVAARAPSGPILAVQDVTTGAVPLAGTLAETPPRFAETLPLGGRELRIEARMPSGYMAEHKSPWPWGVFGLGCMATALLVTAIWFATSRARIRQLVERRSREIEATYETLAHEAQQRLWAMKEMHQIQERLRQIIDLVPNWIYVKDRFGSYLLANEATAEAYGTTVARLTAPSRIDFNSDPKSDEILRAERALMDEQRSEVTPVMPFRDARGRERLLRTTKIPIQFEDEPCALLCVAIDVTEEEHATRMLRSQNRILAGLARGQEPDEVLAELVRTAEELVPGMRCSVLLRSADGLRLEHGFGPSLPEEYNAAIEGLQIGPDIGSCGAAAHSGERVVVEDVSRHPNWAAFRDLARRAGIGACWSQPIRSSDGEVLGTFAMYYAEPRGPGALEEGFIEAWAHLAGIVIERRRLVTG